MGNHQQNLKVFVTYTVGEFNFPTEAHVRRAKLVIFSHFEA